MILVKFAMSSADKISFEGTSHLQLGCKKLLMASLSFAEWLAVSELIFEWAESYDSKVIYQTRQWYKV